MRLFSSSCSVFNPDAFHTVDLIGCRVDIEIIYLEKRSKALRMCKVSVRYEHTFQYITLILDDLHKLLVYVCGINNETCAVVICDDIYICEPFSREMRVYLQIVYPSSRLKKASSGFEYLNETFFAIVALKFVRLRLQSSIDVSTIFANEKFEK